MGQVYLRYVSFSWYGLFSNCTPVTPTGTGDYYEQEIFMNLNQ
jgi:hypothetical protein